MWAMGRYSFKYCSILGPHNVVRVSDHGGQCYCLIFYVLTVFPRSLSVDFNLAFLCSSNGT